MSHNKKIALLILGAVLLLLLISVPLIFLVHKQAKDKAAPTEKSEQEKLLERNSQVLQGAQNPENTQVRDIDQSDYVQGELSAPLHLIVYDDFDNIFSVAYHAVLERVRTEYVGRVAIALRPYPLRSHANSVTAALAVECAGQQGKFWEMAAGLYTAAAGTGISAETVSSLAAGLELKTADFSACLADQKSLDKIQTLIAEADSFNVTGAPTTFINNIPYPGAYQYEDFTDSAGMQRQGLKSIIEAALTK